MAHQGERQLTQIRSRPGTRSRCPSRLLSPLLDLRSQPHAATVQSARGRWEIRRGSAELVRPLARYPEHLSDLRDADQVQLLFHESIIRGPFNTEREGVVN